VISKSAILISAQFNIRHIIRSWSNIKSPCPYVLPLLLTVGFCILVYCEAVRLAILATAWLLVFLFTYLANSCDCQLLSRTNIYDTIR